MSTDELPPVIEETVGQSTGRPLRRDHSSPSRWEYFERWREEIREAPPVDWTRLIFWAIGLAVIALVLLCLWVWLQVRHHIHTITAAHGSAKGSVFAFLVAAVVVFIGIPALFKWLLGRN